MATMNPGMAKGLDAGGALTKYRFVKQQATDAGEPVAVVQCDTIGERSAGVSMFSVSTAEITKLKGASVVSDGRMIVEAGAAVAVNDEVMCDGSGRAVTATSGHYILGRCDGDPSANAGDQISVMLSVNSHVKVP